MTCWVVAQHARPRVEAPLTSVDPQAVFRPCVVVHSDGLHGGSPVLPSDCRAVSLTRLWARLVVAVTTLFIWLACQVVLGPFS